MRPPCRKPVACVLTAAIALVCCTAPAFGWGLVTDGTWKASSAPPDDEWLRPGYDDSAWPDAPAPSPMGREDMMLVPWARAAGAFTIWDAQSNETTCLRKSFYLERLPERASVTLAADDDYTLYINGAEIADNADRLATIPGERYDITTALLVGENVIGIVARDYGGRRCLVGLFEFADKGQSVSSIEQSARAAHSRARRLFLLIAAQAVALAFIGLALTHRSPQGEPLKPSDVPLRRLALGLLMALVLAVGFLAAMLRAWEVEPPDLVLSAAVAGETSAVLTPEQSGLPTFVGEARRTEFTVISDQSWLCSVEEEAGWRAVEFDDNHWVPVEAPYSQAWPPMREPGALAKGVATEPIWTATHQPTVYLRKSFNLRGTPVDPCTLYAAVDDDFELFLNGEFVGSKQGGIVFPGKEYGVHNLLRPGKNTIAMKAVDRGGARAALACLKITAVASDLADASYVEVLVRKLARVRHVEIAALVGWGLITAAIVVLLLRRSRRVARGHSENK